jgi:hypothetical protein
MDVYQEALAAAVAGQLVVCIPVELDGVDGVYVWTAPAECGLPYVVSPDGAVRAGFHVGLANAVMRHLRTG